MPNSPTSKPMNARILENVRTPALCATRRLSNLAISKPMGVLTLAKGLLHVLYAAVGLPIIAIATVIKNAVAVLGSRFMKNAWDVICRLKALNFDARS